jgi:formyl-CoA transferase
VGDDPRFHSFAGRVDHRAELDEVMAAWIGARLLDEVLAAFEEAHAAAAPVMTMADLAVDPHLAARGTIAEVDGTPMQGLIARLSRTPGHIRWAGRPLGADTDTVLAELDDD